MPVITTAEVKNLLSITAVTWDEIIETMIPFTQARLAKVCNNEFIIDDLYYQGRVIFAAGTITVDTADDLETNIGFADGDELLIHNSYRNDGYKLTASITGQVITLATGVTCVTELSGASVFLSPTQWPEAIKPIVAAMVKYDYAERPKAMGSKSIRLGPYSETFQASKQGYPENLVADLSPWILVDLV